MSDLSARELWLSRNTVIEMLTDRGYSLTQAVIPHMDEFVSTYTTENKSGMNFTTTRESSANSKSGGTTGGTSNNTNNTSNNINNINNNNIGSCDFCAVHFTSLDKLSKKSIENILLDYTTQGVNTLILVVSNKLNHATLAYINKLNLRVEVFLYRELLFNPTKHTIVPQHRVMTSLEKSELLSALKCGVDDLPIILSSDVIARYLGAQRGEVVEIIRKSKTTGESKYYRAVQPG